MGTLLHIQKQMERTPPLRVLSSMYSLLWASMLGGVKPALAVVSSYHSNMGWVWKLPTCKLTTCKFLLRDLIEGLIYLTSLTPNSPKWVPSVCFRFVVFLAFRFSIYTPQNWYSLKTWRLVEVTEDTWIPKIRKY